MESNPARRASPSANCKSALPSPVPRREGRTATLSTRNPSSVTVRTTTPVGELVPMQFRTFDGRKQVLIVSAEGKALYEDMVGHPADLHVKAAARAGAPAGQEGLIECATPRAGALRPGHARGDAVDRDPQSSLAPAQQAADEFLPLTPAQQRMASEMLWYRQWLLDTGRTEDDLIPFFR
jgi:hypothetical protein